MDIIQHREMMKTTYIKDGPESDQTLGVAAPHLSKPALVNSLKFDLETIDEQIMSKLEAAGSLFDNDMYRIIQNRRSHRVFKDQRISLLELSFLLWATHGIKEEKSVFTLRTVPSGGARHALETYLVVQNVEGLEAGIYHYLPLTHQLECIECIGEELKEKLIDSTMGQKWIKDSGVTFVWSAVPYRGEWRYLERAHKLILLDVGHVCQNLYLACEVIGCGTCAINAYDQEKCDSLLKLNTNEELTVYLSPVGKV